MFALMHLVDIFRMAQPNEQEESPAQVPQIISLRYLLRYDNFRHNGNAQSPVELHYCRSISTSEKNCLYIEIDQRLPKPIQDKFREKLAARERGEYRSCFKYSGFDSYIDCSHFFPPVMILTFYKPRFKADLPPLFIDNESRVFVVLTDDFHDHYLSEHVTPTLLVRVIPEPGNPFLEKLKDDPNKITLTNFYPIRLRITSPKHVSVDFREYGIRSP